MEWKTYLHQLGTYSCHQLQMPVNYILDSTQHYSWLPGMVFDKLTAQCPPQPAADGEKITANPIYSICGQTWLWTKTKKHTTRTTPWLFGGSHWWSFRHAYNTRWWIGISKPQTTPSLLTMHLVGWIPSGWSPYTRCQKDCSTPYRKAVSSTCLAT